MIHQTVSPILVLVLLPLSSCMLQSQQTSTRPSTQDFTQQRRKLVDELKAEGVTSPPVLDALLKVPRHEFVPQSHQHLAYENRPSPLGMSKPFHNPLSSAI